MTRRFVPLITAGLLLVSTSVASAQDPGSRASDSLAASPADLGKPAIRTATAELLRRLTESLPGFDSLPASEILNRGKPTLSAWANLRAPKEVDKPLLWLFGGPTFSDFPRLERVACDQAEIASCGVDRTSFGPRAGFLVWPSRRYPIGIGTSVGRSKVSVWQRWDRTPYPELQTTELEIITATLFLDAWHSLSEKTRVIVTTGPVWSWNRSTVTSYFAADTVVDRRRDNGLRWTIGTSIERDITRDTRLRFEYRFINGRRVDADRQHQWAILFGWVPGGRIFWRDPAPPPSRTPWNSPPAVNPDPGGPDLWVPPIIIPTGVPEVGGPPGDTPDREGPFGPPDGDDDGVPDADDQCRSTPPGATVDARGCADGETPVPSTPTGPETPEPPDGDDDGVPDADDQCPRTPAGAVVAANGCSPREIPEPADTDPEGDEDGDDVRNADDLCPGTPAGTPVDADGCGGTAEEVENSLPVGEFAVGAPETIPSAGSDTVRLVVRPAVGRDSLRDVIRRTTALSEYVRRRPQGSGVDTLFVEPSRIAARMVATLSGPAGWRIQAFQDTQSVAQDSTVWTWVVTPECSRLGGLLPTRRCVDETVTVHVEALVEVDGGPIAWPPQERTIGVRNSIPDMWSGWVSDNWPWLLILCGLPLVPFILVGFGFPNPFPWPAPPTTAEPGPRTPDDPDPNKGVIPPLPRPRVAHRPDPDPETRTDDDLGPVTEIRRNPVMDPGEQRMEGPEDVIGFERTQRPVVDAGTQQIEGPDDLVESEEILREEEDD